MPNRTSADSRAVELTDKPSALLARGRACYERREWNDAFEALSLADRSLRLGAEDLERLAWSAGLIARDDEMLAAQERVYHARIEAREELAGGRAAFWLGFRLLASGEPARASGWLSRAQRLIDQHGDCVEQGYLLLPASQTHLSAREFGAARDCAVRARLIGERFAERDLIAFALNLQGRVALSEGRVDAGLALLDEAMVAVTSGELSPVVTGIIYCSSIASCHRVFALERVREWTAALSKWCDANPQLGMFTGYCLVHRAEVLEMSGAWPEAIDEARRAIERCVRNIEREAAGHAYYQQAEIHRLRGEHALAEGAYREASRAGFEPQPGLALLRLAAGDSAAAASSSRRMVAATRDRLARTRFLPAHVDIMLAEGALDEASAACHELQETAAALGTEVLDAIAARACASVHLAERNPQAAIDPARRAFGIWQRLGAPYLAARARVLVARACLALGDGEGAQLEVACARECFARLGAGPDSAALESLGGPDAPRPAHRLTDRELQVLRLVACGNTNKAIARELALSEKTVDRHVSNIFAKAGVSSRAAATAFAYEHKLI
jgi:DNA-binding CsgD family transcriptional regulator